MLALLSFVLAILASPFKSKSRLEAENAALRQQLIILRRKVPGRVRLKNIDRWFLDIALCGEKVPLAKTTTLSPGRIIEQHAIESAETCATDAAGIDVFDAPELTEHLLGLDMPRRTPFCMCSATPVFAKRSSTRGSVSPGPGPAASVSEISNGGYVVMQPQKI
jgi:hypothetical protein